MPLEHKDFAELRHSIEHRRAQLGRELREDVERVSKESYGALKGEVADPGDEALADVMADTRQAELSRDIEEMRALDAALERMLHGEYGQCLECGQDIALARLRVEPAASRCIGCQESHERRFAQPGRARL
ncbi:MAG: TraR/DksA family transcriptional regulator [Burkholderiaceae bacterium]